MKHRTMYIVLGTVFVVLLVVGLVVYRSAKANEAAKQKADQLIAALHAAGLPAPSQEQITRVLGDDGGAVCADPDSALKRAQLYSQIANGAGGPGTRPVIGDDDLVRGELEVIRIYCPDELPSFQRFSDDLKTADTNEE